MPHTRPRRARPEGGGGAGARAWLRVSPSWPVQGGQWRVGRALRGTVPWPASLRPGCAGHGPARGRGEHAAVVAARPGPPRGPPHATSCDERRGGPGRVPPWRALPHGGDGGRLRASAVPQTAGVSATPCGAPLQSLCALLARGPLWTSLVDAYRHLL